MTYLDRLICYKLVNGYENNYPTNDFKIEKNKNYIAGNKNNLTICQKSIFLIITATSV